MACGMHERDAASSQLRKELRPQARRAAAGARDAGTAGTRDGRDCRHASENFRPRRLVIRIAQINADHNEIPRWSRRRLVLYRLRCTSLATVLGASELRVRHKARWQVSGRTILSERKFW